MVEITIINRIQELNSVYSTFESLKLHPVHIKEIRILFKNFRSITISKNAKILIDGYECCIAGEYFDLRNDVLAEIHYIG
ncbi:hypothetical protein [Methanobrevibacter sp.]|uniref:hypothetical protein n=1 Tax=Methanobrevibacter sp. TaxID=66852 RepID=UPI0025DF7ABC|nr:hypothetical protein [Methanobrevibacter sp.]MBR4447688.1 hypothetical protein [Methanobrevibacter sp.]